MQCLMNLQKPVKSGTHFKNCCLLRKNAVWPGKSLRTIPRNLIRTSLLFHILLRTETSPCMLVPSGNDRIVLGKEIGSNLGHVIDYLTMYFSLLNIKKHSST
jgi:hypothetical protein